jgi:hypothetical protein
MVKLFHPKI